MTIQLQLAIHLFFEHCISSLHSYTAFILFSNILVTSTSLVAPSSSSPALHRSSHSSHARVFTDHLLSVLLFPFLFAHSSSPAPLSAPPPPPHFPSCSCCSSSVPSSSSNKVHPSYQWVFSHLVLKRVPIIKTCEINLSAKRLESGLHLNHIGWGGIPYNYWSGEEGRLMAIDTAGE